MAFDQFVFIGSVDLCLIKVLLFHPSAAASGDMIMASLLDLGADLQAVRKAVESVGWRLEVSRQERSSIMARRAAVTSDRSFQSSRRCANKKALKNAVRVLHILAGADGRVHGVATEQARFHEVVALDRGQVLYLG